MYAIDMQEPAEKLYQARGYAIDHMHSQGQGAVSWMVSGINNPTDFHLCFRLGNKLFAVLVDVVDSELSIPDKEYNRLISFCESNNITPCIYKIKEGEPGEFSQEYGDWNLIDAQSGEPVNPVELVSDELIEMTDWEVHDMAVQQVVEVLKNEGKKVYSHQSILKIDPTIWFDDGENDSWVVVRAERYPEKEAKVPDNIDEIKSSVESRKPLGCTGYFASVVIASQEDSFDGENITPLYRGHGMFY